MANSVNYQHFIARIFNQHEGVGGGGGQNFVT